MVTHDDAQLEWDDEPSADPKIKKDYEAALGAFLLAFNRMDNTVSDVIVLALKKAGREEIPKSIAEEDRFARKVQNLDLISLRFPEIASQSLLGELRALGSERNNLAHGYFDQNPFGGGYDVVARQRRLEVSVEKIHALAERAEKAYLQVRRFEAHFWHEDLTTDSNQQ
jgi:hypothetical protein